MRVRVNMFLDKIDKSLEDKSMNDVVRITVMLLLLILSSAVLYAIPYVLNHLKGWKFCVVMALIIVACSGCLIGFVEIGCHIGG